MKKSKLFALIIVLLLGIPVVIAGVLLATFDVNGYRTEIGAALSERLGRAVMLGGPINLGFSPTSGIALSVKDVSIANPAGSQRPVMARIGRLAMAAAFLPLLRHELDIKSLNGADVDVHLDSTATPPANTTAVSKGAANNAKPLGFYVQKISLKNISLAIHGGKGETSTYTIDSLTLNSKASVMQLSARGSVNGAPLGLDIEGPSGFERLGEAPWPFDGKARYAGFFVKAKGTLDVHGKKIQLDDATLTAGATKVTTRLTVAYGGVRPVVRGTISGNTLDPKDLESQFPEEAKMSPSTPQEKASAKYSSRPAQLPFEDLKAVDLHLVVSLGRLDVERATFRQVHATVDLKDGRLLLSPVDTLVAGGKIDGLVEFDAQKSPVRARAVLKARHVDLEQLAKFGGFQSYLEGKSDIDYDIASEGDSPHDLTSHLRGRISLVMGRGKLQAGGLTSKAASLLNTLIPGAGGTAGSRVNCLAARFNLIGERMQSNAILLDTGTVTAMGTGEIDLGYKTIRMVVNSRPKVPIVGAFTPALRISGPLANPRYGVDTASYVQKAEGLVEGQSVSGVPAIIRNDGQNGCVAALDHPRAAQAATTAGANKILNRTGGAINGLGGKILHGIGGALGR